MSFTIHVDIEDPDDLRYADFLQVRDTGGIACVEEHAMEGGFVAGTYHHLYEPGISTRSLEVILEEGQFSVRIMTGSCAATHQLAVDLIEVAGRFSGGQIGSENGDDISLADLAPDGRYGTAWCERTAAHLANLMLTMARRDLDEVLTMNGPHRPFHLGRRTVAAIDRDGGDPAAALLARIRRAQYAHEAPDVYAANVLRAANEAAGTIVDLAVWGPGQRYLLPKVDAVAVVAEPRADVPMAAVPAIADGVEYLDDHQLLVAAVSEDDWPRLVARARPHAVELASLARPKPA